ncbi:MerR family transcriptional regulator [Clostridium sediminicola]|uniref:MerR family transcriptional regulator n=1 Tax=Clostridium sediminicola TaxID=3114879 RepID=UPI0031F22812
MKKYFSIGETSKINNVSIQALRLYDKMGLLKPAFIDPDSNYRYYTPNQFVYIDLIKYARYIGSPLKELKEIINNEDISFLFSFIEKQQSLVQKEITRLKRISEDMENMGEKIQYTLRYNGRNKIYFREIKQRFITKPGVNEDDSESDKVLELRKLTALMEKDGIMYEGEYGNLIYIESFLYESKFRYKHPYITLYADELKHKSKNIDEIPAGKYICIAYLNKDRYVAVKKLKQYIEENNIILKDIILETDLYSTPKQYVNNQLINELQILI